MPPLLQTLPGLRAPRQSARRSAALLHWRAEDTDHTKALSGQALTFTRATGDAWAVDANGHLVKRPHSAPRYEMVDLDGDGVRETAGLVIESSRTNLVLQSNDLTSGSWTKTTASASQVAGAGPDGGAMSVLIEAAGAGESPRASQAVTITAGNYVCLQAYVIARERFWGMLYGEIGADRLGMSFRLDTLATAQQNLNAGVLIDKGIEFVGLTPRGPCYRVWVTGQVNAAGTALSVVVRLFDNSGNTSYTGDGVSGMYWGFINCQQFTSQGAKITSPIATTTGSVTRGTDLLTATLTWPWQDALSIYVRGMAPLWKGQTASAEQNAYALRLGTTAPYLYSGLLGNAGCAPWVGFHDGSTTLITAAPALSAASPAVVEWCGQVRNIKSAPQSRIDSGGGFTSWGTAGQAIAAWGNTVIPIGSDGGAQGFTAPLFSVKVAAGLFSLEQMRGLF